MIGLLGGVLFLDRTAVGNVMISRPIVAGPAMGLLVGEPWAGLWVGALFEMLWIGAAPIGAFLPPDDTPATGATVAAYSMAARHGFAGPEVLSLAIVTGLPACFVGRGLDTRLRRSNADIVHWVDRELEEGRVSSVERGQLHGVLGFFAMGAALAVIVTLLQFGALRWLYHLVEGSPAAIRGLAVFHGIVPALGFAAAMALGAPTRKVGWAGAALFLAFATAGTLRLL
ncbi:MAG: PTS sugar transporter subunit IIC [Candidatus Methylomirabilis sp.]|nr:PTS sugar transporter subunit IIC [Deltaproteobacteria bacterium]